jgi:hypothetical protein
VKQLNVIHKSNDIELIFKEIFFVFLIELNLFRTASSLVKMDWDKNDHVNFIKFFIKVKNFT